MHCGFCSANVTPLPDTLKVKPTWVNYGKTRDWYNAKQGQGREFLFHAVQVKSIWTPFGV
jgi:aldehyde dehydrogenase (NAD+)